MSAARLFPTAAAHPKSLPQPRNKTSGDRAKHHRLLSGYAFPRREQTLEFASDDCEALFSLEVQWRKTLQEHDHHAFERRYGVINVEQQDIAGSGGIKQQRVDSAELASRT